MACETMRVDGDFSLDYIAGKQHLAEIIEKKFDSSRFHNTISTKVKRLRNRFTRR